MSKFEINKIVVPYDFSTEAMNALDTALVIGQQQGASILLLHVIEKERSWFSGNKESCVSAGHELTRLANEDLNILSKTLSSKYSFPIEYTVLDGETPSFEICQYAWENDCDIVVIGKSGKRKFGNLFGDPIHLEIMKNCSCPVLLVPAGRLFTRFNKIVFPVRVAPGVVEKYDLVRPFMRTNDAVMVLVGLTGVNNAESYAHVSDMVDTIADKLRLEGVAYTAGINFCNSIPGQLLEICNNENADLIVITTVVNGYLNSSFLDYYSTVIVDRVNCPVLSIRPDIAAQFNLN